MTNQLPPNSIWESPATLKQEEGEISSCLSVFEACVAYVTTELKLSLKDALNVIVKNYDPRIARQGIVRQDITILPADDPKKLRIGHVIYEVPGDIVY